MTKRQRTILFFAAALLFLLATPTVILYSQGWRIDWNEKTVTHTGGMYMRAVPSRASIYVNGEFVKRTDLFFDSSLITNLLPGNYNVRIEKEGYIPWTKTLPVQKAQVTEAKHIILFPENLQFQTLFSNVMLASLSPDASLFAFQKKLDATTWELTSFDIANNQEKVLFEAPAGSQLQSIQWAPDSNTLLLQSSRNGKEQQVKLGARGSEEVLNQEAPALPEEEIPPAETFEVLPNGVVSPDEKNLLILDGNTIAFYDKETKEQVALGTFKNEPKNLAWLDNDHIFFSVLDDIFASELDVRGKGPNSVALGTFKNPELFWSPDLKTLFVLSEGKFLSSETLLP
ncbi:MAG: PEGA domain-containing protein [Candidatus Wildermuthbacteria bacterium]|nr:PEGA domain-containing protein [Candidatus Wildermuthbacteria bacterium]